MPLVDARRVEPALGTLIGTVPLPEDVENRAPAPTLLSTISAAFGADNTIVNAITFARDSLATPNGVEPGYNPWKDIQGTPYEDHWESFTGSNNPRYTNMLKARIDREEENRRTVAAAGTTGVVASIAASVLDPTILIPIGGEVAAAGKGSYAIGRAALRVGAAAGASTALQEGVLQATQETRTAEESTFNIGASVVLGGLLGGGVSLLTRGQQDTAAAALHNIVTAQPGSVGAAAVEHASLADLTVAGNVTERLANATKAISPNLRANFRESAVARSVSQQLAENTLYQTMHGEGRTVGAAVETLARSTYNARMVDAVKAHNAIYADMKKGGLNMSRQDFEEAVGDAMRNGDAGGNEFVSRAASAWRERVFEPFKNEAINLGLLPEDVGVDTAASYFSRVWNREALTAREPEFKDIVGRFYEGRIAQDYAESAEALKSRMGALDQELADLRLSPDDRAKALSDIDEADDALDASNPDQIDRVTRINEHRRQARAADQAGNLTAAREARSQAASVAAEGGDGLRSYLAQRRALRGRRRNVDLGYAGMVERADAVQSQIADIQEANSRSLSRLIQRGRVFEREAQRLDPGKLAQKLSDLRTAFAEVVQRSERAQDRIARAAERLGDDAPAALADRLKREAAAEAARHERLSSLSRRMEAAEALDPDAAMAELRDAMEAAAREVSDTTLARGERAQRLQDRLARLDPAKIDARVQAVAELRASITRKFYDRWEIRHLGEGVDLASAAGRTSRRPLATLPTACSTSSPAAPRAKAVRRCPNI